MTNIGQVFYSYKKIYFSSEYDVKLEYISVCKISITCIKRYYARIWWKIA